MPELGEAGLNTPSANRRELRRMRADDDVHGLKTGRFERADDVEPSRPQTAAGWRSVSKRNPVIRGETLGELQSVARDEGVIRRRENTPPHLRPHLEDLSAV